MLNPIVNVSDFESAGGVLSINTARKGNGHEGEIPSMSITGEGDTNSMSFVAEDESVPDNAQCVVVATRDFLM